MDLELLRELLVVQYESDIFMQFLSELPCGSEFIKLLDVVVALQSVSYFCNLTDLRFVDFLLHDAGTLVGKVLDVLNFTVDRHLNWTLDDAVLISVDLLLVL